MNKYDEVYDFRIANIKDVDNIMTFIREEWSREHILGYDKEFFLWQYGRKEYGDKYNINFFLMTEKGGRIVGVIGFVPYSNDAEKVSCSCALTKVVSQGVLPMSGIEMMKRQRRMVGDCAEFSAGTNPNTILPIFKTVFRYKTGVMQQYYILNPDIKEFQIAITEESDFNVNIVDYKYYLKEFYNYEEIANKYDINEDNFRMSRKSPQYIKKRFFEHPYYVYKKWFVYDENNCIVGVVFGREIKVNTAKVLRIVDYRGDLNKLKYIGAPLKELIKCENYEYVDLFVSDLSDYNLEENGYKLLNPDGKTIIPHYFEPFVRENQKIYYQESEDIVIFKADGDQDRPNIRK